jgi:cytochrome d ubiquinol oxidase subunit II
MDYNLIWFILIAVLFIGYVVLDGFDLGVGMTHFIAKNDNERRILLNSIGPVWDGNEVWLITAGGALFAAFPHVYATVFSGYYTAFMLFLLVLIMRASSLEFRSKVENESWRNVWDSLFNVSSYLIILLLGVAFANVAAGIPIDKEMEFTGGLFTLLNPYAIFFGLTSILIIRLHGKLYLLIKTEGELQTRILATINRGYYLFLAFFVALAIWTVSVQTHLLKNYANPAAYLAPIIILAGIALIPMGVKAHKYFRAFLGSSLVIAGTIMFYAIGMFPNFVISTTDVANSLTAYNAASSEQTLSTMFIIAMIGVPLVLVYQIFVYRIFSGKVKIDSSSY